MYLSAHDLIVSRDHTLNNLLSLSSACLEAGQRVADLAGCAGREALQHGGRQLTQFGHGQVESLTVLPISLWLDHGQRSTRLFDGLWRVLGDTQQRLLEAAEAQVRAFDGLALRFIEHADRYSPWEAAFTFQALRRSLQTAEQALHGVSAAAIGSVELAGQEVHAMAEAVAPAEKKRSVASRRKAAAALQ